MPADVRDVICRYHYDPLDRLVGTTPTDDDGLQRFYCKSRLATEIQGGVQRSIFQQGEQLLAQQNQQDDLIETSLLATDPMRSVLRVYKTIQSASIFYSPYGHSPTNSGLLSLLGFNGERPDRITGHYILGNGYRAYNPMLMRFNCPDNLSPFGHGGFNAYAYCSGDPVNLYDESGHSFISRLKVFLGLKKRPQSFPIRYKKEDIDRFHKEYMSTQHLEPEPAIRLVKKAKDLDYLKPGDEAKFVFTKSKKLIVGKLFSISELKLHGVNDVRSPHHGSLVQSVKNKKALSAGFMEINLDGSITLNNHSGHYKPSFDSLDSVEKYMKRNGIFNDIKKVRQDK